MNTAAGAAVISNDCMYRYTLHRTWHHEIARIGAVRSALWIMLNPSTANSEVDDATIRKVMGFCESWGYNALTVVNLFAYRSRDPTILSTVKDAVGPENDKHIRAQVNLHRSDDSIIVAAWGADEFAVARAAAIAPMFEGRAKCLGTNRNGSPGHPLYKKGSTALVPWPVAA
jgi:hypothetical protein